MDSPELSQADIRRRLKKVYDESSHLKQKLPPESPYNAILTLSDIAHHVDLPVNRVRHLMFDTPERRCDEGCAELKFCVKRPKCREMCPAWQTRLSLFFRMWEAGALVKAKVGGVWDITPRHKGVEEVASPYAPQIQIQVTAAGPRLKL